MSLLWHELRRWIEGRTAQVVVAALIMLFLYDAATRIWVPRDANLRRFDAPKVPLPAVQGTLAEVDQKLAIWVPEGASKDAEEHKVFVLQAILGASLWRKAVIAVLSKDGVFQSRRSLIVGEEVEGWKLSEISRNRAVIIRESEAGHEARTLQMFPSLIGAKP